MDLDRFKPRRILPARLLAFFIILGPGIITANADNDASGIYGYSLAGAQFQYRMLWVLLLSTIALAVAQEICARMGAVTGKGLADLIREEYGVRITMVAMTALTVANFATTVSEFAGILAALQLFAGPAVRFIALPLVAIGIWYVVVKGTYRRLERILLGASLIYLLYIASAFLARPDWGFAVSQMFWPSFHNLPAIHDYVFMVINVVGTTITPWGQFYIQSSVRDKGIKVEQYGATRIDVYFGAFFTNFVAFFIVVCCAATLYKAGIRQVDNVGQVARALLPLAGRLATLLFAIGLFNASCFGAIAVPLSTAYAVTEALGWETGLGRRAREAPLFIGVFTAMLALAAGLVMLFPNHLVLLIILPNIVGGALLPIILILMQLLVNKRRIMGQYINSPLFNVIAWTTTAVMVALSVTLLLTSV